MFPLCMLQVVYAIPFDHDPIKLELISQKQFRFRFKNTWLREGSFLSNVANFWQKLLAIPLLPKLISVSSYMAKWGRTFFHKFRDKVVKQNTIIDELKNREDDDVIQLYFDVKEELNVLLLHEESYWKQRAKIFWLEDGDTNSKFFHAAASSKKKSNFISALKSEEGNLVSGHDELGNILK